jgi:hypothetical protein
MLDVTQDFVGLITRNRWILRAFQEGASAHDLMVLRDDDQSFSSRILISTLGC